jgi:hypothetical protein
MNRDEETIKLKILNLKREKLRKNKIKKLRMKNGVRKKDNTTKKCKISSAKFLDLLLWHQMQVLALMTWCPYFFSRLVFWAV